MEKPTYQNEEEKEEPKITYINNLNSINLVNKIVDNERQFLIGYSESLQTYFMNIPVWWIAMYERWYKITKEDFELYQKDKKVFYEKYKKELGQKAETCFTENFVGSENLRDYDGMQNFQRIKKSKNGNPFAQYALVDDIFYAVIEWEDECIFVPPLQHVQGNFPLRKNGEFYRVNGEPICFRRIFTKSKI